MRGGRLFGWAYGLTRDHRRGSRQAGCLDGWSLAWVSFQGGGQSSCRYFDRLCGKGNSMWSRGPSFNRTSPVHMPRGGTGRCSLGRGDDGSVHLVAKCGEEYCTASNSTLKSLLVWKTAQPCAAKRRLPPSRPAAQLCELAQPDDEQIMRARRTGHRWRCVCGGGLDGACGGWLPGQMDIQ